MTRDGTVGRSDATEKSLPVHRDIDPARVMRPRFADSIRANSCRFRILDSSIPMVQPAKNWIRNNVSEPLD